MSINLLLIDDDEIDAEMTLRVIERRDPGSHGPDPEHHDPEHHDPEGRDSKPSLEMSLDHVWDGVAGLDFLRLAAESPERSLPDLVLLDLQMPRMDGPSFLRELRQDQSIGQIPVAVLLASPEHRHMVKQYSERVDDYLVKPIRWKELTQVLRRLGLVS